MGLKESFVLISVFALWLNIMPQQAHPPTRNLHNKIHNRRVTLRIGSANIADILSIIKESRRYMPGRNTFWSPVNDFFYLALEIHILSKCSASAAFLDRINKQIQHKLISSGQPSEWKKYSTSITDHSTCFWVSPPPLRK